MMTNNDLKHCEDMSEVRHEIDRIDRNIVPLLIERLHYIKEAGRIKNDRNVVRDEARVEDVVSKALAVANSKDSNAKMVEDVYRFIINWSINYEFGIWDDEHKPNKD